MKKDKWVWMPHPGHLIVASDCRFHLNTYVGGFLVSTVGEYLPDSAVREILAASRGVALEGIGDAREADYMRKMGYREIGHDRLYETMVFAAKRTNSPNSACCPFEVSNGHCVNMQGYNDPKDAYLGHLKLCAKWAKKQRTPNRYQLSKETK